MNIEVFIILKFYSYLIVYICIHKFSYYLENNERGMEGKRALCLRVQF